MRSDTIWPSCADRIGQYPELVEGGLFDETVFENAMRFAQDIPFTGDPLNLEFALDRMSELPDVSAPVMRHSGSHRLLAEYLADECLEELGWKDESWRYLQEYCRHWLDDEAETWRWIEYLFLEYDFHLEKGRSSDPCVFLGLNSPLSREDCDNAWGSRFPEQKAFFDALELLLGHRIVGRKRALLEKCFSEVDGIGRVLSGGVMNSRDWHGVRLVVLLPVAAVPSYFSEIAHDGIRYDCLDILVEIALQVLQDENHLIPIAFDALFEEKPRIGDRVGLELVNHSPKHKERIFRELARRGLCDPEVGRLVSMATQGRVQLDHVKPELSSNGLESVKAYLSLRSGRN